VVGRDPGTDLALLRLEQPVKFPLARWAKGADLSIGELVLALARTRRGNIVASSGIVSGYINEPWRTWHGGELDQFIRPDLNLYPGFSGGPLLNSKGEFLGVNTTGLHRSGITIPAATVVRVAAELLEKGRIERPYLGLAMQAVPLTESLRAKLNLTATEGLLVVHVEPGSPADKAGVFLGDVLLELGDKPVADTDTVQDQLRSEKPGAEIQATFIRGGAVVKAKLKLEARPAR
jgi:S1-C subfamily serine protease